ncbi:MAG: tetratricopeptide repeat protein [Acidobacteriota bacterium]|nr:tetratricopeptide repeat protein [Acidobacteriota bacterium]
MKVPIFTIEDCKKIIKVTTAFLLILIAGSFSFAQYKGAPVKKDKLLQALRSRQLQTSDIVTIINSNGVDFRLTTEVRKSLIAAGARPEVIKAVANNPRLPSKNVIARANKSGRNKPAAPDYDELLDQAIYSYKNKNNPKNAVQILQTAAKIKPKNPAAYQMLGFVYLYGLNNLDQAEKSMRESFVNGGSAVFRVFHDDDGDFKKRCTGSLYISRNTLRFESDDNVHTFETSAVNVDKIKLDTESSREWKKHSVFKIFLKIGDDKIKFRFAPLTGQQQESKLVERFIAASNSNINFAVSITR